MSTCNKTNDQEEQKPKETPRYFAFEGKCDGTITDYNYSSGSTGFKTDTAHIATVFLNQDSSGLLADGIPLEFRSDSAGRFPGPQGMKAGEFLFSFDKTDTTLFYFYNERPDNVQIIEFTGKKRH